MSLSRFIPVDSEMINDLLEKKDKPNTKRAREHYWQLFIKFIGEEYNLNELDLTEVIQVWFIIYIKNIKYLYYCQLLLYKQFISFRLWMVYITRRYAARNINHP